LEASDVFDPRLARRAYESGRLVTSALRAVWVTLLVGVVGWVASGPSALTWLPLTFATWTLAFWRGEAVLRGAWFGFLGGAVTFVLPMSVLRPCCVGRVMQPGMACCTMPGMCLLAGGVVGLALAVLVPVTKKGYLKTAAGMSLGVTSIAVLRCSTLFAGEALGLVGGLLAGLLAASAAKVVLGRRATA
jgi:hypothetical protein